MCRVSGCENGETVAKDLCNKHYHKNRRYGDPEFGVYKQGYPECSVEDCTRQGTIRGNYPGICRVHQQRLKRGQPLVGPVNQPTVCSVRGCPNPGAVKGDLKGFCEGHRRNIRLGRPIKTLNINHLDEDGNKQCWTCLEWFPGDQEWSYRGRKCNRCTRNERLLRDHNISIDNFEERLESQGGGCACCGDAESQLVVDHDHNCCPNRGTGTCGNCIRKILCHRCNLALGFIEGTPELVTVWLDYLKSHTGQ